MTGLTDLSDAWVAAVLRASWQGSLAALVVWSVCRLVPSMPARFQSWLWRLVVLKFAVTFLWSAPIGVPLLPAPEPATVELTGWATADPVGAERDLVVRHEPPVSVTPWRIAFLAWSLVVGWQAVRLLRACRAAHRLRRDCRPSRNRELLDQLAAVGKSFGLGTLPPVLETDGDGSPVLVGLFRPAVVFPTTTLNRLSGAERAMVLGHELAHARRGDLIWGLVAAGVRAVFFFHPLVWLSERRLQASQEAAADELAVLRQNHDPVGYATLLVSVVGKLGPGRSLPTMSVGAAGSLQALKQRLSAMRFVKPLSPRVVAAYGLALAVVAVVGVVPWVVVPASASAQEKAEPKREAVDQKDKNGFGRFVSFKDGSLTIESNAGALLVWNKIAETTKTFKYDPETNGYKPVEGSAAALNQVKAGTYMMVGNARSYIRIGARKDQVTGTFVSFKDGRLLAIGTNLPESFTKKYGTTLQYNKFRDDVPVHESVDGGEYKPIGTANKVLGSVKEGTVITVHGEGDDNITLVQLGVPKKK